MSIKSVRALFVFAVAAMMLGSGTTASAAEKQLLDEVKPVECQDDPACIEVKIAQKGGVSESESEFVAGSEVIVTVQASSRRGSRPAATRVWDTAISTPTLCSS